MSVTLREGEFTLDASVVADGLGLEPTEILPAIRDGKLTSLCERGTGEDAGRNRLTFFYSSRLFSVVVDETGAILERRSAQEKKKARRMARLPR